MMDSGVRCARVSFSRTSRSTSGWTLARSSSDMMFSKLRGGGGLAAISASARPRWASPAAEGAACPPTHG